MEKKYFLFGQEAVRRLFDEEPIEDIREECDFATFYWDEKSAPEELLSEFAGWDDWSLISEQEYKQLNDL